MDPARDREVADRGRVTGRGRGVFMRGGRRLRGRSRAAVLDEIMAAIIYPVINHGLSTRGWSERADKSATLNSGIYCKTFQAKQQVKCAFCKGI
jgi:hypothetical protein